MLNDVHPPPLDPDGKSRTTPLHRAGDARHPVRTDRAHSLERTADHHGGTNLVFSDPEDRGDSFNTTMSAVIVGCVLVALGIVAFLMWK